MGLAPVFYRMDFWPLALCAEPFELFGFDVHNLSIFLHNEVAILSDGSLDESLLCESHATIYLLLQESQFHFAHNSIIFWYDSGSKISIVVPFCPQATFFTPPVPLLS